MLSGSKAEFLEQLINEDVHCLSQVPMQEAQRTKATSLNI